MLMLLCDKAASQYMYVWSPYLTVESTVVRSFDSNLVEHLADSAMHLSWYGHLSNYPI